MAEARGINFAAVKSGKIKMFVQTFAIGTVLVKEAHVREAAWGNWFTIIVFAAMVVLTIYSGLDSTRRTKAAHV
jgi:phosphatidylglycerophosphate synthase